MKNVCQKAIKKPSHPLLTIYFPLLNTMYIKCSNVSFTSLKLISYKYRLMFAYYNILRFYCFKKSLQVTSVKFFFKDVQISKYRFFMISNPDFSLFFQSLFAPFSVGNTISGSYFSQNLKIPYWKSSFLIHRQILRPTLSWKDLWNSLLLYLVVEIL